MKSLCHLIALAVCKSADFLGEKFKVSKSTVFLGFFFKTEGYCLSEKPLIFDFRVVVKPSLAERTRESIKEGLTTRSFRRGYKTLIDKHTS